MDKGICKIHGCNAPAKTRQMCGKHIQQFYNNGGDRRSFRPRGDGRCTVAACDRPHHSGGFCSVHRNRMVRHGTPTAGRTPNGEPLRYLFEVVLKHKDAGPCLIWPFAKPQGRGSVFYKGKTGSVSRLICEIVHGKPAEARYEAAHECGRGHEGCVNPHHVSWKTPSENQADRIVHGTSNRGGRHPMAKLRESDVQKIKDLKGKIPQRRLGEMFSVKQQTVSAIQSGKSWCWL